MKKKRSTTWKMHEWVYLGKLLTKGYPILDCLQILQKDTSSFQEELQNGKVIQDILLWNAKPKLQQHLLFFLSITSFGNAILCATHIYQMEGNLRKRIMKECSYPLFIFLFAYATLWIFLQYVIPQLLLSFSQESLSFFFIMSIQILKFICNLITIILLLVMMERVVMKRRRTPQKALDFLSRRKLVKEYISYMFSNYLKELDMDGLSTKRAIEYLTNSSQQALFAGFVTSLKKEIEEGEDFKDVVSSHEQLCPMFQTCFTIGVTTGNLSDSLQDYTDFQEEQWYIKIQKFSIYIQCFSYGFVGFLIILVYQIMLVPLQLLETM